MYTDVDVLPADGWLFAGDPGVFPVTDTDPDCPCFCDHCSPPPTAVRESSGWAVPGVPLPAAEPHPLLGALRSTVDVLGDHGPLSGSRTDTAELLCLAERVRALGLRELAEMDATGGHQRPGAHPGTTAAWLRDTRHLGDGTARAAVSLAVELRDLLPDVAALLTAGQVSVEHAAAVAGGVRGLDPDLVRAAGDGLAALSLATDPADIRRRLRDSANAVDDRLARDADRRARDRQHLRLAQVGAHTAVDGTLAGEDGATVRLAMAIAVEAARGDGARRSPSARQADILVSWANSYLQQHSAGDSLAGDAHTARTHLLITCSPEHFQSTSTSNDTPDDPATAEVNPPHSPCRPTLAELVARTLAGGGPVSPSIIGTASPLSRAALRRLACDATVTLTVRRTPGLDTCPAGCPVRRAGSASTSRNRSTSAGPPAPSAAPCSWPWSCGTAPASPAAATGPPPTAPPTTSSTGPRWDHRPRQPRAALPPAPPRPP